MSRYDDEEDKDENKAEKPESNQVQVEEQGKPAGKNWSDPNNDDLRTTLAIIP